MHQAEGGERDRCLCVRVQSALRSVDGGSWMQAGGGKEGEREKREKGGSSGGTEWGTGTRYGV